MKKLAIILALIISFISYGQGRRTVSALGVEEIQYGTIAKYIYDGNPFNDNEKSLSIFFDLEKERSGKYSWESYNPKADIVFSMSDISSEKIEVKAGLLDVKIQYRHYDLSSHGQVLGIPSDYSYISETRGFYEFIFDNDKSTYFKLDSAYFKNLKSLDNKLFLKFRKHKKALIRWNYKKSLKVSYECKNYIKNSNPCIMRLEGKFVINNVKEVWAYKDYIISLSGFTAAYNKYREIEAPTGKNKNLYKVSNGLANVNPFNLEKYIDKFILDAKINHNIDLSYVNKRNRLIIFRELKGKTIATAYKMNNDNDVFVKVDPENWNAANQSKRWYIIYHELGHDILNLEHGECGAMMTATTSGNYTWGRLEKDKNTMFESYKLK